MKKEPVARSRERAEHADLVARLEAVVADARAAGKEHALAPELRRLADAAESARAAEAHSVDGVAPEAGAPEESLEPIPMRFGMVGDSPPMRAVFELLEKVAPSDVAVLIQGETGTGKELVARALHEHGLRRGKPFLAENCAAVSPNLLESELFGHKKGSFTGAHVDRAGHFVTADGGTVFLDEIGDMPIEMQAKLLRVLQDGEVRPVGANQTLKVDVRLVAATNKDLPELCKQGLFREDLYFRLNVITVHLPPLRDRDGDVVHIVRWLLARIGEELGRPVNITPEAVEMLAAWRWPGNVRQLENELRRASALAGGVIGVDDLSPAVRDGV